MTKITGSFGFGKFVGRSLFDRMVNVRADRDGVEEARGQLDFSGFFEQLSANTTGILNGPAQSVLTNLFGGAQLQVPSLGAGLIDSATPPEQTNAKVGLGRANSSLQSPLKTPTRGGSESEPDGDALDNSPGGAAFGSYGALSFPEAGSGGLNSPAAGSSAPKPPASVPAELRVQSDPGPGRAPFTAAAILGGSVLESIDTAAVDLPGAAAASLSLELALRTQAVEQGVIPLAASVAGKPGGSGGTTTSVPWNLGSGNGINVEAAWNAGYTGSGIGVGVVDDGFQYSHADLDGAYRQTLDYDFRDRDDDARNSGGERHGTAVFGIIAAEKAVNGKGGEQMVGVAYDAAATGFRIHYTDTYSVVQQYADALAALRKLDVGNNSWGETSAFYDDFSEPGSDGAPRLAAIADAIQGNALYGRGELGTTVVFAAGNGRGSGDNVNYHNFQNSPYTIAVAGTDSYGKITSFSTPGAAVLVSAPAAGVLTTDLTGIAGYSRGDYAEVNGTSFAAPAVSGVVALIYDANPYLGYRDVQEILAYSSKKTDGSNASWDVNPIATGVQTNGAMTWNGGGLHFSHDYGFGLVDAAAAVRLAESWLTGSSLASTAVLGRDANNNPILSHNLGSGSGPVAIADLTTITSSINVAPGSSFTIDKILVDLNISHARAADLVVKLTSPSGTEAVLIRNPKNGTSGIDGAADIVFTTSANNFWGEDTVGTWTLTVTDTVSGNVGELKAWTLRTIGDAAGANDRYVYTNEFSIYADVAGRNVLTDSNGGVDTLNCAAIATNQTIDLGPGNTSTIAGKMLTISAGTLIEIAHGGDGADTIIGNDADNILFGHRGADTLTGGAGQDRICYYTAGDSPSGAGRDVLSDFVQNSDKIDVSAIDANPGTSIDDLFSFIDSRAFSGEGQLRYEAAGSDTLVQGDLNGDALADLEILVRGTHTFVEGDFAL